MFRKVNESLILPQGFKKKHKKEVLFISRNLGDITGVDINDGNFISEDYYQDYMALIV
jgi:hypothetical protein